MKDTLAKPEIRVLILISTPKLADKAAQLFREGRYPIQFQMRGHGTASSEMMDVLGLGNATKTISLSVMPKWMASGMMERFKDELALGKPNTGIAFTTAITGISNPAMRMMDESVREEFLKKMESDVKQMATDSKHGLIIAIVNQGFSEELMDAAKQAGARGGTVLHARRIGAEETMKFWGISVQEEKEMVLIITKKEEKLAIMKAIGEQCGMHSDAQGFVISLPVDDLVGVE